MLPNAFIIGVQKSGSTFLASLLKQHPDICFSDKKELHFFSKKRNRKKGLAYYESRFEPYNGEKIIMEATPGYIVHEHALKDMRETIGPDAKLLVIIREPINRLISHYRMRYSAKGERRKMDDAVSTFLETDRAIFKNYVNRGLYYDQLQVVEKYFVRENIHITVFEDFIKNPQENIKDILRFLEIEESVKFNLDIARNPGRSTMPNLYGQVFFAVPKRIRLKILGSLTHEKKRKFFNIIMTKKKALDCGKISNENLKKLKSLYSPQIDLLQKEYNIDLSSWDETYKD